MISNPSVLQGVWVGTWRAGDNAHGTAGCDFQLVLEADFDFAISESADSRLEVARFRTPPLSEPVAFVTVRLSTGRVAMELGKSVDVLPLPGFGFWKTADAFVDGAVSVSERESSLRGNNTTSYAIANAGWLAKDGTFGVMTLRLADRCWEDASVKESSISAKEEESSVRSPEQEAVSSAAPSTAKSRSIAKSWSMTLHKTPVSPLRIKGSTKARFKAAVRVVQTHGFLKTLAAARKAPAASDEETGFVD